MSLYDDASLIMYPSGYKASKIYSLKPTDGSGDLTFTRSNDTATRVGPDGLIEKVRTNVLTYSNDFSNAAWTKGQQGVGSVSVVTPNYTTDPFGGNNAWRFQCNLNGGTTSNDRSWMLQAFSPFANSILSIYIKLNVAGSKTIIVSNGAGDVQTITNTDWVRINIVTGGSSGEFRIGLIGGSTSDTLDCSIAFAQAETGDIATDYIPTTSAAVSVGPVANVPRLDYSGGGCPKLLLEPQRTNLALYSEQFDNAAWTKSGVTVTANQAVSPDGYQNADKVTNTTTNDFISQIIAAPTATAYATSFYIKNEDSTTTSILVRNAANSLGGNINWTGSELVSITGVVNGTLTFESVGNDWYRIFGNFTSVETVQRVRVSPDNAATGKSVYLWGFQLEQGATYATSYIPTLGAAVTRGADACSKTGISSLIGQTSGTLYSEFVVNGFADFGTPLCINDGTLNESIWLTTFANGDIRAEVFSLGSIQASFLKTGNVIGQTYKIAIGYASNNFAFFVNGVQVGSTDISGSVPVSMSRVDFDYTNASLFSQSALGIKEAILFPTRLTNTKLAELTTL